MNNKVFVAVDTQNLWYSCRGEFGPEYRVDFNQLIHYISDVTGAGEPDIKAIAYVVSGPNHNQTNFIDTLRMLGYEVKKRNLRFYGSNKKQVSRADWDLGIAVDAFRYIDDYDIFILVSGDGDFIYLTEFLKEQEREVLVMSFAKSLNKHLAQSANAVHPLGEDVVYKPYERYRETQRERDTAA